MNSITKTQAECNPANEDIWLDRYVEKKRIVESHLENFPPIERAQALIILDSLPLTLDLNAYRMLADRAGLSKSEAKKLINKLENDGIIVILTGNGTLEVELNPFITELEND